MIYCPKCHEVIEEVICPYCDTDVVCYNEQKNNINNEHINMLRSNHAVMTDLCNNQNYMNDILEDNLI